MPAITQILIAERTPNSVTINFDVNVASGMAYFAAVPVGGTDPEKPEIFAGTDGDGNPVPNESVGITGLTGNQVTLSGLTSQYYNFFGYHDHAAEPAGNVLWHENWDGYDQNNPNEPSFEDYQWSQSLWLGGLVSNELTGPAIKYADQAISGTTSFRSIVTPDSPDQGDPADCNYFRANYNEDGDPNQTLYLKWKFRLSDPHLFNTNVQKHIYFPDVTGHFRVAIFLSAYQADQSTGLYGDLFGAGYNDNQQRGRMMAHLYRDAYTDLGNIWLAPTNWYESVYSNDIKYFPNCYNGIKVDHRLSMTELENQDFELIPGHTYEAQVEVKPDHYPTGSGAGLRVWLRNITKGQQNLQLMIDYQDDPGAIWTDGPTDAERVEQFFQRISVRQAGDPTPNSSIWVSTYHGGGGSQPPAFPIWVDYDDMDIADLFMP